MYDLSSYTTLRLCVHAPAADANILGQTGPSMVESIGRKTSPSKSLLTFSTPLPMFGKTAEKCKLSMYLPVK